MGEFAGHLHLIAKARDDGQTYLASQSLRAPYHVSKPYWEGRALVLQVVNPTAGILQGDTLESRVRVDGGASLLMTTPSASRVFKMKSGRAVNHQHFAVEAQGWLEVSPEPLVPHHGSRFEQATILEVAENGELVYGDFLMPGRMARGEVWGWSELVLGLTLKVGGRLILRERFAQTGESLERLASMAGQGEGACFANLVMVSPRLREEGSWRRTLADLHGSGVWLGVSPLRANLGGWSVKFIAQDGIALRDTYAAFRAAMSPWLHRLAVPMRKQ